MLLNAYIINRVCSQFLLINIKYIIVILEEEEEKEKKKQKEEKEKEEDLVSLVILDYKKKEANIPRGQIFEGIFSAV